MDAVQISGGLLFLVEDSLHVKYRDWPAEVLAVATSRMLRHSDQTPRSITLVNSSDPFYIVSLQWKFGIVSSVAYYRVNTSEKTGQYLGRNIPLNNFLKNESNVHR